jgi:hypothetical protein
MENRDKQDEIRSWCQFVQQYETDDVEMSGSKD